MEVKFIGRHYEIPESLKKRAERKIAKLKKLLGDVQHVEVILSLEKYRHTAEVLVKGGVFEFRAKETTGEMLTSLNKAFDIIEAQIKKEKEKRRNKKKVSAPEEAPASPAGPRIIPKEAYSPKPLTVEEAIAEMEGMGEDILVYRNSRTKKINVIYRKGSDYYLIEPEF